MDTDIRVQDHGSIAVLVPLTEAAMAILAERMPADAPMWGNGYAVEPRYLDAIITDLEIDGYTVH